MHKTHKNINTGKHAHFHPILLNEKHNLCMPRRLIRHIFDGKEKKTSLLSKAERDTRIQFSSEKLKLCK